MNINKVCTSLSKHHRVRDLDGDGVALIVWQVFSEQQRRVTRARALGLARLIKVVWLGDCAPDCIILNVCMVVCDRNDYAAPQSIVFKFIAKCHHALKTTHRNIIVLYMRVQTTCISFSLVKSSPSFFLLFPIKITYA